MDGLTLLQRARDAGLRLEAADTLLKITGPRKAEPLVRLLAEHKAQVLDALRKVQEVQKVQTMGSCGAQHDPGPYASALTALRANCPAHVREDRWHQALADATTFATKWGAEAQAFDWTEHELFGLHPVPERRAANYSRLSRVDDTGLLWLLRGRPVIVLTSTEAIIRCHSGANLTYRKQPLPACLAVDINADGVGS
jgi:hypothetical protein